ncbi:hypothetical protein [Amycolatopsis sp. cmx-4-54]|uniref:hypothetical protein n=1 Tax=Amycolatopsis sp. cmx-4-54 TaxID=2790936 RepID=UPI00397D6425
MTDTGVTLLPATTILTMDPTTVDRARGDLLIGTRWIDDLEPWHDMLGTVTGR